MYILNPIFIVSLILVNVTNIAHADEEALFSSKSLTPETALTALPKQH